MATNESEGTAREPMSLEEAQDFLSKVRAQLWTPIGKHTFDAAIAARLADAEKRTIKSVANIVQNAILDNLPSECPRCHQELGDYYADGVGFVEMVIKNHMIAWRKQDAQHRDTHSQQGRLPA